MLTQAEIAPLPLSPAPTATEIAAPAAAQVAIAALANVVASATGVRPLTDETLGQHDERQVVPTYGRSALTPAVVHFSVGGFHRSHQLLDFNEIAERRISDG